MNFRTKIWMLPASAAAVFVVGLMVSYVIGMGTSTALERLRTVDNPYFHAIKQIDRSFENFRLTLQSAAAEGDIDKLNDVEEVVAKTRNGINSLNDIEGKKAIASDISAAFERYQSAALQATRTMLQRGEFGDQVKLMQSEQRKLEGLLKEQLEQASQATLDRQAEASLGVTTSLWANLITGIAVLSILGLASKLVIASVWRDLGDEPNSLHRMMQQIADGDLQIRPHVQPGDKHSLNKALSEMTAKLCAAIATIRHAADSIATASREIASGNHDLSIRTESTASSLQETASSVERLTGSVQLSAKSALNVNQLAGDAANSARRGGDIVREVVDSMNQIDTASRKITDIIGVIDGIAFQTNILALNAAVEAARAGEQGRGFAVVAGEVRTLAQRSAHAAREIKMLIKTSSEKVDDGAKLVRDAGGTMNQIVERVQKVTDIIGKISSASTEQSEGIGQVNRAVCQLDQMTQQNAALVEQSAAAATSLQEQASRLAEAVASFKIDSAP